MTLNLSELLAKDLLFKQHPDGSYMMTQNGELVRENMNDVIDTFMCPAHAELAVLDQS